MSRYKKTRKSSCVTQEAYRPPCKYSFCCPTRVPPPNSPPGGCQAPPPGGVPEGLPDPGTPPGTPRGGYLITWPGLPDPGTPPGGVYPPRGGFLSRVPPRRCLMAFWEMLQSIMGYGYPPPLWTDRWMDGRTDACQNITFPRTPYAGGNNTSSETQICQICRHCWFV